MLKKLPKVAALAVLIGPFVSAAPVHAAKGLNGIAVKFFGEGHANVLSEKSSARMASAGIDLMGFDCFELPILDPASERSRGTGVDCLKPISTAGDEKGEGIQMEAYTFFLFKDGMVVNHGCTSVRPFFEGIGDAGVTHLTGSIGPTEFGAEPNPKVPEVCSENQGIVKTTGAYRYLGGEARLSGAVNMSNLDKGIVKFSCLFVLKFDWMPHK